MQWDEPVWMPEQPYASSSETIDDDMTDSPAPPYCVQSKASLSIHSNEAGRGLARIFSDHRSGDGSPLPERER